MAAKQYEEETQFVTDINEYDVLTGRGSGPYEQPGNVHFRELVATRKIEYLSLNPRDLRMKNQIAQEVIDEVRSRGGRFLRKIQVENNTDGDLYEFVDEATVLEKAKQALRQNRNVFMAKTGEGGPPNGGGGVKPSPPADLKVISQSSATAATSPTKPPPRQPMPRQPSITQSMSPIIDLFEQNNNLGGGSIISGSETLDFTGITGPPPDPTTPEEWEAFHAYWSDGNEPNRRLWDGLQAQLGQQQAHQQQFQPIQHHQAYRIPDNLTSSSHYYSSAEEELWDQMSPLQQRCALPRDTPIASNVRNIANSSNNLLPLAFQKQGYATTATATHDFDSGRNQQDFLNFLSCQIQDGTSNHQGFQQHPAVAAAAAPDVDNRAMMIAYMAQMEQIYDNNMYGTNQQHQAGASSAYMHSGQDPMSNSVLRAFEEVESLPRKSTSPLSMRIDNGLVVRSVATKGHGQSNSNNFGHKPAGPRLSNGSQDGSQGDDHDSFFSGLNDMSLPSVSMGEVSDFGKHSFATKSQMSKDVLKGVLEDAAERVAAVPEIFQEVVATVPSLRPDAATIPVAPLVNPAPVKSKTKKRRSLSSYYRQVNAAVASSGRHSLGDLCHSSNSTNSPDNTVDAMSCSMQSMSVAETSENSPPIQS